MHECPRCGQACDCIGDDLWNAAEAEFCECDCEDEDFCDFDGDDDFGYNLTGDARED
jgi:hypothetical protein